MTETAEERNKALVLKAFDTLFNKRDYEEAARYWSPTACSPSTGTCCRTKRQRPNPRAGFRCSGPSSLRELLSTVKGAITGSGSEHYPNDFIHLAGKACLP